MRTAPAVDTRPLLRCPMVRRRPACSPWLPKVGSTDEPKCHQRRRLLVRFEHLVLAGPVIVGDSNQPPPTADRPGLVLLSWPGCRYPRRMPSSSLADDSGGRVACLAGISTSRAIRMFSGDVVDLLTYEARCKRL